MASVEIEAVTKRYPGAAEDTIKGIDCSIDNGELLVMLGPSGCGKSTLLRMVAGLERITGGAIKIAGDVVNEKEPKDRNIAMVFQNYALYPHMSVYGNMAYGLKIAGLSKPDIDARVKQAAELLQLDHLLERKPRQLSGGQRQRVAMGRAIVREPRVFLFDEPLSNLDAKLRTQMRVEIKRLQRRLGITSLYVTHDQVEAMTLGDRLMVMNAGVAEQIGAPLDIYSHPASLFVAGFIGSPAMNFLPGRVSDDATSVQIGHQTVVTDKANGHADRPVTIGIRPEHFSLADAGTDGRRVDLHVDLIEQLGADTVVYGQIDGTGDTVLARLPGVLTVAAGDTLPLTVDQGQLHLFDPETGKNLW